MNSTTNSHKIFDEFEVECNGCQRYWTDQCDGVKPDTTKSCSSYLATRNMDIPTKVKTLDDEVTDLKSSVKILNIVVMLHLLCHLLGAFVK